MLSENTIGRFTQKLRRLRTGLSSAENERLGGEGVKRSVPRPQLDAELRRLDSALARIETGEFGVCQNCRLDIESSRLEVDPATPFCAACFEELASRRRSPRAV